LSTVGGDDFGIKRLGNIEAQFGFAYGGGTGDGQERACR